MKHSFYILLTVCFLGLWSSCRKDFEFTTSNGTLEFSKDTIYLDTIFNRTSSSTYNLKVYNRSDNDILIPSLKLQQGESSNYRLNVDGEAGKIFENVKLLAKDSLFIFIEVTLDINTFSNPEGSFLYSDKIEFSSNNNSQNVELVTLVKDAVFIYPDRDRTTKVVETLILNIDGEAVETELKGRELQPEELTFTNEKPYVIYGFAAVPNGKTLTINAGARIHFHAESGIVVTNGASLQVNGAFSEDQETLENEVIFESDRLEPNFSNVPGQWGTLWLLDGSINNQINYATIKNATLGILCDGNPDDINNKLTITNSKIYNSGSFGILGRNTSIKGNNLVINNAGLSSFAGTLGGKYNFTHSTIVNYWNNGFRQFPAVLLNNFVLDEDNNATIAHLQEANFNNCIIYGNDNPEILLDEIQDDEVAFNFKFTNCLIRFRDNDDNFTGPNYNFDDTNRYEGNIYNEEPHFTNPEANQLTIGEASAAINQGLPIFATQVPRDILNIDRTLSPDVGAYQYVVLDVE